MTILASYERHPDLGCEAVVFIDDESMACFQIQRELVGGDRAGDRYCISTGASAPIYDAIRQWRRVEHNRLEFALTPRASRLFGDEELSFEITPVGDDTVDDLVAHVERLLR
ncbi:hypothetical protein EF294_15515 [Gordonia oryzae]|uniref:Uncharacterized protein n=1 Tax=Gordonia oryzae TaxID=2487349 RepID=A0A3N4GHH0_9ACTN|nr:hypothetical protein [Gordonia oryzae]RPA58571.1 hypothetical protein EF294_15515 [Gordonia oryzae]